MRLFNQFKRSRLQGSRQFFDERIQLVGIANEFRERWFEIGDIDFEYFGQIVAYPSL